ncbi:hypothetical protein D3C81_1370640 [compost metagenome]
MAHGGLVHHLAVLRMMFVAVGTADQQGLAVKLQQSIADFHLAEADVIGLHLNNFSFRRQQGDGCAVQRGCFRAPQRRLFHREAQGSAILIGTAFVDNFTAECLSFFPNQLAITP